MTEKVYPYDAFLSHSSKDKDFVRLLDRRLRAVGIRTFFDETDIPWGGNIPATIEHAIDSSRHLILVLSPDAVESEWVDLERCITTFRSPGAKKGLILPLLRRDCEIPASIRVLRHLVVRSDREFQEAWPQIIEHLTGVPIEEDRPDATKRATSSRQMLSRPENKNIAVVCPLFGASRIYYTELLAAITDTATKHGYELSIVPVSDITRKRPLISYCPHLASVAGVILITSQVEGSTWLDECASLGLPVVLLHDNIPEKKARGYTVVSYIRPRLDALSELVSHLVEVHRCRNLSVVMVNPRNHALRTEKLSIIERTIRSFQLDFSHDTHLYYVKSYSHMDGIHIADDILEKNPETDAVICLADITAIGILQRLDELGFRNRIRVTGFDNIEVAAYNSLTTIDQQLRLTGERALFALHNAIQQDSCIEFPTASDIATTLVVRESCCFESRVVFRKEVALCRRAIYYLVTHPTISEYVRSFRRRVYELDMGDFDTGELIGSAALYPDHVTVVGTFSLEKETDSLEMCDEIGHVLRQFQPFVVITSELQYFPGGTLSIGLTDESRAKLLELQRAVLPLVKRYRRARIEPEFRKYLYSNEQLEVQHTREFGEPYVLELYKPHISLVSGLRDQDDCRNVLGIAKDAKLSGIRLTISELWLMEEEEIGGTWKPVRPFEI